jgi:hypothetical protein
MTKAKTKISDVVEAILPFNLQLPVDIRKGLDK